MSAYPNLDAAIAAGRVTGQNKPAPGMRRTYCPFCGGCPTCCDERWVADPDIDPDGDVASKKPCPTCQS